MMCPFCYIGKRRLEAALDQFSGKQQVEITWKSFQLNPDMPTELGKSITSYLAEIKGWTLEYSRQMHAALTASARELGLHYDFDRAVVANSFDAHRVVQLAKTKHLGDAMEERFFKAYFSEGENIADHKVLLRLGHEVGLLEGEIREALATDAFAGAVRQDINEAMKIGVNGVPFFVFDRKYAVSGAQDTKVFLQVLEKALADATS